MNIYIRPREDNIRRSFMFEGANFQFYEDGPL